LKCDPAKSFPLEGQHIESSSKKNVSGPQIVAYAIPFVLRPTMQVKSTESGASNSDIKPYTFTDAIAKYGHLLKQFDLGEAYRRAGSFFKGQLEQKFVVLKKKDQHQQPQRQPQQHQHGCCHFLGRVQHARGNRKRTRSEAGNGQPEIDGWLEEVTAGATPVTSTNVHGEVATGHSDDDLRLVHNFKII
jgi:hypothetical protein